MIVLRILHCQLQSEAKACIYGGVEEEDEGAETEEVAIEVDTAPRKLAGLPEGIQEAVGGRKYCAQWELALTREVPAAVFEREGRNQRSGRDSDRCMLLFVFIAGI